MPEPKAKAALSQRLRERAEGHLDKGDAPRTQGWATSMEALGLLHTLASTPASAGDAMKLLHELQVHQVELDLQHEQMEQSQQELDLEIARYAGLFDCAPVALASVDREGRMIEVNPLAAQLFGIERDELPGRRVAASLAAPDRTRLTTALQRLGAGGARESFDATFADGDRTRSLRIMANACPGGAFMLAFVEPA